MNQTIEYGEDNYQIDGLIDEVFFNSKPELCPIEKCVLLDESCLGPYKGKYISSLNLKSPFGLVAKNNVLRGWTERVCIECQTEFQKLTSVMVNVTQLPGPEPCLNVLSLTPTTTQQFDFTELEGNTHVMANIDS